MTIVSDNIKKLRESRNMSQKELGELLGVSDKTISTWELGTREPRMCAIQKIADIFSVQKSIIIEGSTPLTEGNYINPETAKLAQEAYNDPDVRILLDACRDLSPEDLQIVIDLVKRLKK